MINNILCSFTMLSIYTLVLGLFPSIAFAKTSAEVKQMATTVTVNIEYNESDGKRVNGSGVIYQKQGDMYTIVTNAHVACGGEGMGVGCPTINPSSYVITTPDYNRHRITGLAKRVYNTLDLATIKFRSSKNYPLAQFTDSSKTINQETIYTAGFPGGQSKLRFSKGKLIASVKNRVIGDEGGYTMLYDAFTLPGMSGSGVFNSQGQVIAIHGNGDKFKKGTDINDDSRIGEKLGINRGIPANRVTLPPYGPTTTIDNKQFKASTADEFMVLAYNKTTSLDSGEKVESEKKEAIKLVSQAIKLQPNYAQAYLLRGWLYSQLRNNSKATLDYNKAISIDPEYDASYMLRAATKIALEDQSGALNDYNKAISINPDNFNALEGRGFVRQTLNDNKGALDDFNQASKINPIREKDNKYRIAVLIGKCGANGAIGNIREALQDCNKATEVLNDRGGDPNKLSAVYSNLGTAKFRSGDKQGALVDLNKSISLNSSEPNPYINRGSLKYALKDKPGALADFNRALSLKSTNVNIYLGIAIIKEESGEFQESLSYYKKAEEIYSQKGDILNKSLVFYNISKLQQKINPNQAAVDSLNAAPASQANSPDDWLQRTLNQGLLDLLGMPRK